MPVMPDPSYGTAQAAGEAAYLLEIILTELKNNKEDNYPIEEETSLNGLKIYKRGKMVWWEKNKDAADYRLRLFVKNNEIDVIEIDRDRAYHTFADLVGTGFKVQLEVEDRNGMIIDSVSIKL